MSLRRALLCVTMALSGATGLLLWIGQPARAAELALTSADYPGSSDFTYAYDAAGNLIELVGPSGTLTRTYSDADRLLTEDDGTTTRTLTYDDNGNLLDNDAGVTYSYDTLGRLVGVSAPGLSASYTLDGAGNRLAATLNSVTTSYDLDYRGLATVLSDGTRRFLPGAPAAGFEASGTWHNGLTDAQGSVLGDIDTAGSLSTLSHFDPWGSLLGGGATATGPGYTGEWTDATGLVNLRARAYDPSIQRFLGRDPFAGVASAPTTWNRFAYANANPLTFTDPSGHFGLARIGASIALQMTPFFGDFYSGLTGLAGFDPIAGIELTAVDRGLALGSSFFFGGGFHLLSHVDEVADLGRGVDRLANLGTARGFERVGNDLSDARAASRSFEEVPADISRIQRRAAELNGLRRPYEARNGTTVVIRSEHVLTGEVRTFIGTEGKGRMPATWTGALRADEEYVRGLGHAEETVLNSLGAEWRVLAAGTSRNICRGTCAPMLEDRGMRLGGPPFPGTADKTPFRMAWLP